MGDGGPVGDARAEKLGERVLFLLGGRSANPGKSGGRGRFRRGRALAFEF